MPGQKISSLPPVSNLLAADEFPLSRSGTTFKITGDKFASKAQLDSLSAIALTTLPGRLTGTAQIITDWNNALENGWYTAYNATNSPATGWWLGNAETHNGEWVTQTIHAFTTDTNSDTIVYRRSKNNGTWESWYKLQLSQIEQDARYPTKDRGIVYGDPGTQWVYAFQVREADLNGNVNVTDSYRPRLAFHWGGVVASSISLRQDGAFSFDDNPGTGRTGIYAGDVDCSNLKIGTLNGPLQVTNGVVSVATSSGVPTGMVMYYSSTSAPTGWIECNGATIPNSGTTAALYAFLQSAGNPFGGVGKIPDLRGRFIRSFGTDSTVSPVVSSAAFGVKQADAFQGHYHTVSYVAQYTGYGSAVQSGGGWAGFNATISVTTPTNDGTNGTPRTSRETRPANIALLACIKL